MAPSDDAAPPAYSLSIFLLGPVARVAVFALLACASIFIATMGAWMTEDSWLDCVREPASARCTVRAEFALHIATDDALPPIHGARIEERMTHDKNGDHPNEVLILDTPGAPREFSGVGVNGARAAEVAHGVTDFLDGKGTSPARWHLRESAPPALVGFMLVLTVGLFVAAFSAFRRVTVGLDPNTRTLTVRRERWPLAATTSSAPLADAEGCAMTEKIVTLRRRGSNKNSTLFTASLRLAGKPPFELGISSQTKPSVQLAMDQIDARLALWRQL